MAELVLASHKGPALNLCGGQFILLTSDFNICYLRPQQFTQLVLKPCLSRGSCHWQCFGGTAGCSDIAVLALATLGDV